MEGCGRAGCNGYIEDGFCTVCGLAPEGTAPSAITQAAGTDPSSSTRSTPKYESTHRRMLAMLPRVGQLPGTSQDLYILLRTASDYLPTAVRSYLVLARSGVTEQPLDDGSTPRQALMAQLDLIETDIGEALDRNDLDRLLIHGRFLEAQFGAAPGALGLDPPRPGATSTSHQ